MKYRTEVRHMKNFIVMGSDKRHFYGIIYRAHSGAKFSRCRLEVKGVSVKNLVLRGEE